jgi:hypothetical protein
MSASRGEPCKPESQQLREYKSALEAGWSPDANPTPRYNIAAKHLLQIRTDPGAFVSKKGA